MLELPHGPAESVPVHARECYRTAGSRESKRVEMRTFWAGLALVASLAPAVAEAQQQQPGDDQHGGGYVQDGFDSNLRAARPRERRFEPIDRSDYDAVVGKM